MQMLDKKLYTGEFPVKIQQLTYCEDLEMLSIGLANGAIANHTMDIESRNLGDNEEVKLDDDAAPQQAQPRMSVAEQRNLLSNEGTVLASTKYVTSETDTPVLDLNKGQWGASGGPAEDDPFTAANRPTDSRPSTGSSNFLRKFTISTHSFPNIHKKVKGMIVDQQRNILYSTGREGYIHGQDLANKATYGIIKCKNSSPLSL